MSFITELKEAAKARRAAGNCGPYPTGEENDLVAYHKVKERILIGKYDEPLSPHILSDLECELDIPLDFILKVNHDLWKMSTVKNRFTKLTFTDDGIIALIDIILIDVAEPVLSYLAALDSGTIDAPTIHDISTFVSQEFASEITLDTQIERTRLQTHGECNCIECRIHQRWGRHING